MVDILVITGNIKIPENELRFSAIRAQGAGGQNVNKVATAVQLTFNIKESSLPVYIKHRLLTSGDRRINQDGSIVIKAQEYRSQVQNKEAALKRLQKLLRTISVKKKKRIATKPTRGSVEKRLENKIRRSRLKGLRSKQNIT